MMILFVVNCSQETYLANGYHERKKLLLSQQSVPSVCENPKKFTLPEDVVDLHV